MEFDRAKTEASGLSYDRGSADQLAAEVRLLADLRLNGVMEATSRIQGFGI